MSKCAHPGDNHSDDVFAVFHGLREPLTLCGYHCLDLRGELQYLAELNGWDGR